MSKRDDSGDLIISAGEIYEDCAYHPCLCLGTGEGAVWGVSLIDGSEPRACDLRMCGVRILTIEEAAEIKRNGPADPEVKAGYPPDKQWWWPRRIEGLNPAGALEHLFESSLSFLRSNLRSELGEEIIGWYSASGNFTDAGPGSSAEASYEIRCSLARGVVQVQAMKEGRLWPIQKIIVAVDGIEHPFVFEGEQVRGCGRAG